MARHTARSWASMARTARAPIAVLLLGGIGLTVPPQSHDLLQTMTRSTPWAWPTFLLALAILAFSAWYWSRAALAARFGIDDLMRRPPANAQIDWIAFKWLPRFILVVGTGIGALLALIDWSPATLAGAAILAAGACCSPSNGAGSARI